jgi:hypothetical protein
MISATLSLLLDKLKSMDSSLIDFVSDSLDEKKGIQIREVFRSACLWIEIDGDTENYSSSSVNMRAKTGIRIKRESGKSQIWKITKKCFDQNRFAIMAMVLRRVNTLLSENLATILEKKTSWPKDVAKAITALKVSVGKPNEGYFTVKLSPPSIITSPISKCFVKPSSQTSSQNATPSSMSFIVKRYSKAGIELGSNNVLWNTCESQNLSIAMFFDTLKDNLLKGLISKNSNREYIVKMCSTLQTILDPSKLKVQIEKFRGFQETDDDEEEEEKEEDAGEKEAESREEEVEERLDFSNTTVLRRIMIEAVESEQDAVLFDFDIKTKSKSIRARNALATMSQIGKCFQLKYDFQTFGAHVDEQYAHKHLQVKFETEIKSFITCGNSPFRFASYLLIPRYAGKRFGIEVGSTSNIVFTHKPTLFPAYLSYMTTKLIDAQDKVMIDETSVEGRRLTRHMQDAPHGKKNLFVAGIRRDLPSKVKQFLPFGKILKKNFVVTNGHAICPISTYIMNSGEICLRNGMLHVNIKLQQRTKFGLCLFANRHSYSYRTSSPSSKYSS